MNSWLFEIIPALLFLAAFSYLSWRNIVSGLAMILVFLPAYLIRLNMVGLPTTMLELMVLLLFVIWIFKDQRWRSINWKLSGQAVNAVPWDFRWILILWLVAATVSAVVSVNQPSAWGIWKAYFIEPTMFFLVAVYEIRDLKTLERLLRYAGITVIVMALAAFWQYMTAAGIANPQWASAAGRRSTTFFGYPNAGSLYVGPILALYLGYLAKADAWRWQGYKIIVILCAWLVMLTTKSTGAIISALAMLWLLGAGVKPTRSLTIATTIIVITLAVNNPGLQLRWEQFASNVAANRLDLNSSSLEIRLNQWRETWQLLSDHPVTGAGLAGYQRALVPYHGYAFLEIYLYPHNIFLNFWTELGLLGLIAVVWLLTSIFTKLMALWGSKKNAWLPLALIFAWLQITIHGLVDVPYFKNDLSLLWMFLLAVTVVSPAIGGGAKAFRVTDTRSSRSSIRK